MALVLFFFFAAEHFPIARILTQENSDAADAPEPYLVIAFREFGRFALFSRFFFAYWTFRIDAGSPALWYLRTKPFSLSLALQSRPGLSLPFPDASRRPAIRKAVNRRGFAAAVFSMSSFLHPVFLPRAAFLTRICLPSFPVTPFLRPSP